jgi:hypothetical protein
LGAAFSKRVTSSTLNTTGNRSGTRTGLIRFSASGRSKVVSKKNRSPRMVALMVELDTPFSTRCF